VRFGRRRPGVYRVTEDDPDGPKTGFIVAAAFAASEADLSPREPTVLVSQTSGSQAVADTLRSIGLAVWPWLLAVVFGLGLVEWLVDARGR
jgi:hypothetical protein